MALEYSCFMSYRHAENERPKRIVQDLSDALASELEMLGQKKIFLDKKRLKGGFLFNEAIAEALCRSACMVMVYWPDYFNPEHSYCTREFLAMEALERMRRSQLPDLAKKMGLVIPVVIRDFPSLPSQVSANRQCYSFEKYTLSSRHLNSHHECAEEIRDMALYVREICLHLQEAPHVFDKCSDFNLPNEKDTHTWMKSVGCYGYELRFPI